MARKYYWCVLLIIIVHISEVDSAAVPSKVDIQSVSPIFTSGNKVGLNISWVQPHSDHVITAYKVRYRSTSRWLTKTVPSNSSQTSYQLKDLVVGTEYHIRVRALSDAGVGKWSKISVATTFDLPSLSSVRVPSHSSSSLYLQWSSGGADAFILYYWKAYSPLHVSSDTTKSSSYNITGLDSNTAYEVILSARNPLGSVNISVVNSTLPAVPSKVVILSVKPVFVSHDKRVGLQVSWTPPQSDLNITSYKVQSRPYKATEWKTETVTVTVQLTQRSHTLKDLAVGTEYSVRVRAVSDAGAGEWSVISVATTFNLSTSVIQLEVDRGDELLCLDQDVTLQCKHFPAINTPWVHDTRAHWKVNGDVLTPDGIKYFSQQPSFNMTHLKISLKPILFDAEQTLKYSCFLRVINGTILESDEVSISPLMNPMMPSFKQVAPKLWSVHVEINHSRVCFTETEQCTLNYIYEWQAPSQEQSVLISSQTKVTLFNLTPGTPYTLNVTAVAVCESHTLNQTSDTASTHFSTGSFNDLRSYVVASSLDTSACYGSTFEVVCDHPDIEAVHDNKEVFIDSSVSWRRDGTVLTVDDDTYTTVQYRRHAKLLVNYTRGHFFHPGINYFSCFLRGQGGIRFESLTVSIEIPGFPYPIKLDPHNDVIRWDHVARCVPGISDSTQFQLLTELPRNNSFHTQDLLSLSALITIKSDSFITPEYNASLTEVSQKIDTSKSRYVYVILQQSQQNNDYLMVQATKNSKCACFGHKYTLECITSLKEFSQCGVSEPTWFLDGEKFDIARGGKNGYFIQTVLNTSTLRINVTRFNFNMSHSFHCAVPETMCGTSSNITVKPLRCAFDPHQLNATPTSSDITLTWEHNKTCFGECTYNVSIQVIRTVSNDVFYTDTTPQDQMNYTFTGLTPSTTYNLTVLAVCDEEYISNEMTVLSNTTSDNTSDTTPSTRTDTTSGITLNSNAIIGPIVPAVIVISIVLLVVVYKKCVHKKCKQKCKTENRRKQVTYNVAQEIVSMGGIAWVRDAEQETNTRQPEDSQ